MEQRIEINSYMHVDHGYFSATRRKKNNNDDI